MRGANEKTIHFEHVLKAIATMLEAPRDRFGRPQYSQTNTASCARETIRELAVEYGLGGSADELEQIAKVIRHILKDSTQHKGRLP